MLIRLKKPHGERKPGDVFSVPYIDGRALLDDGTAELANSPTPPRPAVVPKSEVELLKAELAKAAEEKKRLTAEIDKLTAENRRLKENAKEAAARTRQAPPS